MASSLIVIFVALALGGIFAALWGVIRISKRLDDLEARHAELQEGIEQAIKEASERRGAGEGAPGGGVELLPRRYPPQPLPLRRPDLIPGGSPLPPPASFGEAVRQTAREINVPALVLVALLILGFAFFLGTFRLRNGEANHRPAPRPAPEAPARPASPAPPSAAGGLVGADVVTRVTVGETALRADPSVQSAVLAVIPAFTSLSVRVPEGAAWAEVEWSGMRGFVRADVLAETESPGR